MNDVKKSALVILASLFLVTSATAFTQGHPLSQIFGESGTFADCGDQVLAGNGTCVSMATSSSGDSGTDDQELLGFERSDGEVTLSLEDGGTASFTDRTGSGSDDVFVKESGDTMSGNLIFNSGALIDLNDGTLNNAGEVEANELDIKRITSRGDNEINVKPSEVVIENSLCIGGNCLSSWSDVESYISTGSNYIGNSGRHTAGGELSMGGETIDEIGTVAGDGKLELESALAAPDITLDKYYVELTNEYRPKLNMQDGKLTNVGHCEGCDIAETVEIDDESNIEPGDVVSINDEGKLVKASERYDSEVAGVVSSSPTILMGDKNGGMSLGGSNSNSKIIETEEGKKEAPLALSGLVPVKVSAANGPIDEGDKLTTSSISGYAVKAEPLMEKNGREIYGSGIIGKAMEPLESGQGKIEMLASIE